MLSRDLQRILKIRDYCLKIADILKRYQITWEIFEQELVYQQALMFDLLQIGELSAGLSDAYRRETEGQISWHQIKAIRNVIVHDYETVQLDTAWNTILKDIPSLKDFCNRQLPVEYRDE